MPTFKLVLYKQKLYSDGRHPIMLRLTHQRKSRYFSTPYTGVIDEWEPTLQRFIGGGDRVKRKNKTLAGIEDRVDTVLEILKKEGRPFSWSVFTNVFNADDKESKDVFEAFEERIAAHEASGKPNTADGYRSTSTVLKQYGNEDEELSFYDIDHSFLKGFEVFLFKKGNTGGGVHYHMRNLRAVYNEAISNGYVDQKHWRQF